MILKAPSQAALEIMRALNLPPNTIGFTLRMRAGEIANLQVETHVKTECAYELAKVLKHYRLEELE